MPHIRYLHDPEGRISRQEDSTAQAEWTVMLGESFAQPCAVVVSLNQAVQCGLDGHDDRAYNASVDGDAPAVLVQTRCGRTDRVSAGDLTVRQALLLAVELEAAFAAGRHLNGGVLA